jgi:diguanylate cyclase (GGDEF)-like protein
MRRPGDFVARYGGEQFAVILPDTDALGAKTVCRNTLRSIRKLAIPNPTSTVRRGIVTMSIGCTTAIPHDQETTVELLSRADEALYHAKVNGRDQACCFDQPAQLPELCPCI